MPCPSLLPDLLSRSFALYRHPARQPLLVLQERGEPLFLPAIPKDNEVEGFVFAPFSIGPKTPLVVFGPSCTTQEWKPQAFKTPLLPSGCQGEENLDEKFSVYCEAFSHFSDQVRGKTISKLVLSRAADFARTANFSIERVFGNACATYPDAFIFLVHTPRTGLWLGATPELLLKGKQGGAWQTTAIAGTRPVRAGQDAPWDAKNSREQAIVADFIAARLGDLGITTRREKPATCRAGNIEHIRSDFFFSLPTGTGAWEVIAGLHPTPAVCGMPQGEAKRFILRHEGYSREYYSGFLGPVGQKTKVYVNLRCMRIDKAFLRLFAGGGIMPDSLPEQEWNETRHKMRTLLAVL